jgi:hypothetical protein
VSLRILSPDLPPSQMISHFHSAFPNARSLEVHPYEAGLNGLSLIRLLAHFPSLEDLSLIYNDYALSRLYAPHPSTFPNKIRRFSVSGTCATIAKILNALASSPCTRTVCSLRLMFKDRDAQTFAVCQETISKPEQVEIPEVRTRGRTHGSGFKEAGEPAHAYVFKLRLH